MENHIVKKSVRSGNPAAKAAPVPSVQEKGTIAKEFALMAIRAGQVTVPVSCYESSLSPMEAFDLYHATSDVVCNPLEPSVSSVDGECKESQIISLKEPDFIRLDLTILNDSVDVRLHVVPAVPLPLRKFQIPPPQVTSHKKKPSEEAGVKYTRESIDNHKRYKIAQYKRNIIRTTKGYTQRQRADFVKNSRDYKSWLFDHLTGIQPQAGLPISHNVNISDAILDKLKGITNGANVNLSLDANVIETMNKMTDAFKEMFNAATFTAGAATAVINNATNKVSSTIDTAMSGISKIMWIVPLIGAAFYACHRLPAFTTPAAIAAVGLILANLLPEGLWDYIKSFWPTKVESVESFDPSQSAYDSDSELDFEAQAGLLEPATLGNIISMSLTYLTIGKKDPLNIVKGLMKEMPSYSRNVDSWTKLSGFMLQVVEHFVNFVRNKFGASSISILQTGVKAVDSWCSRVMAVLNDSHTGGDIMNPDTVQLLCALRDEGRDLSDMYRFSKEVSPILHRYLGQLDDMCRVCSAAMHSFKGGRPQPVVMAMTGKPGVGKSFLCKMLTTMVLKHIISPEKAKAMNYNFDSEVFMKGDSEFWNGYCAQLAAIMDDWGQKVPVAGGENDFIDLIRMANCWAFPLNFADLENKGKNFFKSQFILLTTNVTNIDNCQKVIVAPDAITRRINYGYELSVSSAFAKGTELDFQKVTRYIEEHKKFPFEAWELRKYHFGIGSEGKVVNPTPIKLEDVILQVANSIKKNQEMYKENTDLVTAMLKDAYLADEKLVQVAEDVVPATVEMVPTVIIDLSDEIQPQGGILEEVDFALRATGQMFHDCSEAFTDACVDSLDGLWFPKLDGYRVKFARLTTELREHNFELKDWVSGVLKNPIIQFLISYAASMAIITLLKAAISKVFSWFSAAPKKVVGLVNSFRKKGRIPDNVLAQAVDALEPTDFDEAQITDDGTYEVAVKFTPEVLARAYHRLTGTTIQSNEPQKYKMKHVQINGKTVIESDIVRQGDGYGDDIANICAKNLYQIRIECPGGNQTLGQMLMVRGTAGIMPAHFITMIQEAMADGYYDETAKVVCTSAHSNTMVIRYTIKQFLEFQRNSAEDRDCVAVNFESLRAHRDITKSFILEADLKSLSNIRIRIDTVEGREHFVHRIRQLAAKRCDKLVYGSGPTSKAVADSFEYTGYTKCGDCGGLATLQEFPSNCGRRIVGLHIAGNEKTGVGFCNIISEQTLKSLLAPFNVPEEYFPQGESASTMVDAPVEGSFLGLNKSDKTHGMNPYTSLFPTPLHNAWGINPKVPAKLGPFVNKAGEHIVPMAKAIEGYASPLLHFDKDKIAAAAYHAFAPTRAATKDTTKYERRILSFGEAVAGVPNTNINGIPRGTSPGYPHILEGNTSKRPFFGTEGDYTLESKEAKEIEVEVERIINDARNNIRNPHIYLDFLKDELRAPEKVQAGKSRLISASPMVYVIAFRRYFLAFTAAVQDTRIRNGVAVGINHYTEWDDLAKRMQSKGKRCVAGDFKGFDTSEQPQIHWAILDQINAWYNDGPENARIRSILWLEVVHSRHFGGMDGKSDHFYQWNKSLSSGHPATSIINSFYGLILFNLCWSDIMGETRASEFWEKVYACTYGDDNVLNIDEAETDKFNQASIAAAMENYGMTYTNEKKDGEVANTRTLSEIGFLKRSFRYEPTAMRYVGPIELESALYTCYWGRSQRNMVQNIKDNIEFSWYELALHEPEIWDQYAPVMRDVLAERMGLEPAQLFTRKTYLKHALGLVPFWDR